VTTVTILFARGEPGRHGVKCYHEAVMVGGEQGQKRMWTPGNSIRASETRLGEVSLISGCFSQESNCSSFIYCLNSLELLFLPFVTKRFITNGEPRDRAD
jgi:hypothetical protein